MTKSLEFWCEGSTISCFLLIIPLLKLYRDDASPEEYAMATDTRKQATPMNKPALMKRLNPDSKMRWRVSKPPSPRTVSPETTVL
jgi:hypothetical protein